ncbi:MULTISPECIES: polyphosphate kinase 2 [Flavobacteriaceae]|uniref:ADP/GDP-polyphosphate phosphotransferase n=2 Tax=Flavobacteriaceae TaxID=49546 RepID=A0A4Y8AWV1_9FLAO|nr:MULTISPECIES: polyphosphate kinase 2 [Flavobacteriaceae]TEW76987.1 polyphosphate kinase 2 [Gramella jeungdoensis]GGK58821.1 polyphosphate kinase 2 [Lutibacter litoralis]
MAKTPSLTKEDFEKASSNKELLEIINKKNINIDKVKDRVFYEDELKKLQIELVKLQQWISKNKKRVAIIFEGRDAAGKGGNIRRFTEHLNPRSTRLVALTKPTEVERGQWYFRRYIKELPNSGEIVFFDRSWYNRAVVEPVMGFCNESQYENFMVQVPEFEHMLCEDNLILIKFWFSISKGEQLSRFNARIETPLKRWKFSPVDRKGQELWDDYTHYKEQMFSKTHTSYSPWIIVRANNKKVARLECIRYVLSQFNYEGKDKALTTLLPDPNIIMRYHRSSKQLD